MQQLKLNIDQLIDNHTFLFPPLSPGLPYPPPIPWMKLFPYKVISIFIIKYFVFIGLSKFYLLFSKRVLK